MIAIPVKSNSLESAVSPTFGKVKYFALVDSTENITFIENSEKSGIKAVQLLLDNGVDTLLMSHIGEKPLSAISSNEVKVFFVGKERITIKEAVLKLKNGELPLAIDIDPNLYTGHGKHDHDHHHEENNHIS
jgi:predicted Fe-Mo cluster-binding NifX family protein